MPGKFAMLTFFYLHTVCFIVFSLNGEAKNFFWIFCGKTPKRGPVFQGAEVGNNLG